MHHPVKLQVQASNNLTENVRYQEALERLCDARFASRLFTQDHTLWGPEAEEEASKRLGWIMSPERVSQVLAQFSAEHKNLFERQRFILCGMGGSSLAPELFAIFGGKKELSVLDATHPQQVRETIGADEDLAHTLFIVSSKSGSTVETRSHLATAVERLRKAGLCCAEHILIITDPGSALAEFAAKEFNPPLPTVFADPNVGGRYSAFTSFGVVPAALAQVPIEKLAQQAQESAKEFSCDTVTNPALVLAAAVYAGCAEGFAFEIAPEDEIEQALGEWIEQLVAESTGKEGTGVLPIVVSPQQVRCTGARVLFRAPAQDLDGAIMCEAPLGVQLLLWEVATCALGFLYGVNPFDQPDVESTKVAARKILKEGSAAGKEAETSAPEVKHIEEAAEMIIREARTDRYDHIALQAYLPRNKANRQALLALQSSLAQSLHLPVSIGFGPRFLHSTGQFHKGGAGCGFFAQFVEEAPEDLPIGADVTNLFGNLCRAQADGDAQVLTERGNRVLRLYLC